ncbi:MAG TPA: hypothetical protein VFB41_08430 [Solirubrobacteraceae bacterium]|nr:hypothetical protein [Solirubrobacteraceae bacterium]
MATAATTLVLGDDPSDAARQLASRATSHAAASEACRPDSSGRLAQLVDGTPLPAISATLPGIDTGQTRRVPADVVAFARHSLVRKLLRNTLHYLPLDNRRGVVVFVGAGGRPGDPTDATGCLQARLDALARLQPDAHDPTRQQADLILRRSPDTNVSAQTLQVFVRGTRGATGTSMPVRPEDPSLQTGIIFGGSYGYVAIVRPETTSVTVEHARPGSGVAVHRRLVPRLRLVAFRLRNHTGHMRLVQRAADGRVLAVDRFR